MHREQKHMKIPKGLTDNIPRALGVWWSSTRIFKEGGSAATHVEEWPSGVVVGFCGQLYGFVEGMVVHPTETCERGADGRGMIGRTRTSIEGSATI